MGSKKNDFSDKSISPLNDYFILSEFDCGLKDINDFLKDDALNYQKQKLANTFIIHVIGEKKPVAYFSILNDALNVRNIENKEKNKFNRKIPNNKRINHYPAIKIGRLGVDAAFQKTGFAYLLMDFIKGFSIKNLNSACRLLILDAVNESKQTAFYQKNDFLFLMESDKEDKTRLMYFDLVNLD